MPFTQTNNLHKRAQSHKRGTVLLLALLVMTTVVIGSVGLSSLIMSSLQQTRIIDNSIIAYYAAEAAIEEAVYITRKLDTVPESRTVKQQLSNGAVWTRKVTGSEQVLYLNVEKDSISEIALYDPDDPIAATGISKVLVNWSDDCGGCSELRATMIGWAPGGPIDWKPDAQTFSFTNFAELSLGSPSKLYKLRLLARRADLIDVSVRAYNEAGVQQPIPGRVRIEAWGEFGNARQRLVASMPRRVPLAGLFNFVIFSECSIVKGWPQSCP